MLFKERKEIAKQLPRRSSTNYGNRHMSSEVRNSIQFFSHWKKAMLIQWSIMNENSKYRKYVPKSVHTQLETQAYQIYLQFPSDFFKRNSLHRTTRDFYVLYHFESRVDLNKLSEDELFKIHF